MTDAQVGELWTKATEGAIGEACVKELVIKLVEERARSLYAEYNLSQQDVHELQWGSVKGFLRESWISESVFSFGIDPAEYAAYMRARV